MPMAASMSLPSTLTSKRPIYFRCLLTLAVLIWPLGVLGQTSASDNVVVRWNAAALQGVRDSRIGPPMVARALAIVHTCIFDAWAAYDKRAVGTQFGDELRRPKRERTLANKNEAISFAAYRALVDLFALDKASVFDPLMASLGYDPNNLTINRDTPAGIGNVACAAVLTFRHGDGTNQLGDLHAGAYSDWTGYVSVNSASTVPVNPALVLDPDHWQRLTYDDGATAPTPHIVTQSFVGAQWYRVVPFAMTSPDQFQSFVAQFGPALYGSETYLQQSKDLITISANLTDEQKMIAEYWANGPRTELPPGHWDLFGEFVSRRDHHTVDDDAKMFFALTNAIFDAGIAAWDAKRAFDSVRPITSIPYLFHGQQIEAWRPFHAAQTFDGSLWIPYQMTTFPTPPFPEYISGHSTFSAAGAQILKLFTHSDKFGDSVTFAAGSSNTEPGLTPKQEVTLSWVTFTDAANQAGISRRYGGIHFELADLVGRATGRLVADQAWEKVLTYIRGRQDRDNDEESGQDED
ncbi:MAG: phosphoesterase [Acidobacteria bacterium 13_1_40CM_3_56_11]|nr:MAG: phosphoesterase [Acidobacteria bacterium 13_1_40CM_3_56_11]